MPSRKKEAPRAPGLRDVPLPKLIEYCKDALGVEKLQKIEYQTRHIAYPGSSYPGTIAADDGSAYTTKEIATSFDRVLKYAKESMSMRSAFTVVHDYLVHNDCIALHQEFSDYPHEHKKRPVRAAIVYAKDKMESAANDRKYSGMQGLELMRALQEEFKRVDERTKQRYERMVADAVKARCEALLAFYRRHPELRMPAELYRCVLTSSLRSSLLSHALGNRTSTKRSRSNVKSVCARSRRKESARSSKRTNRRR